MHYPITFLHPKVKLYKGITLRWRPLWLEKISLMLNQCYLPVISPLQSQLLSLGTDRKPGHTSRLHLDGVLGKPSQIPYISGPQETDVIIIKYTQ